VRIRIQWNGGSVEGQLDDSATAQQVAAALPHTANASTWGDEIYFSIPVATQLDGNPQTVVPPGTICFWVQGAAVAIPFGPTPIAEAGECRLVTAVNVIGKIDGDPRALASITDGDELTIGPVT
jgi:uncharacterized protein